MISDNGSCSDTSKVDFIPVGDCADGSQNEWLLTGGTHVSFASDSPQVFDSGLIGFSPVEGVASISDHYGKFLFNTDGEKPINPESYTCGESEAKLT